MTDYVILTEDALQKAVDYFLTQPGFAWDIETTGINRGVCHLNTITWISLATDGKVIVIPCGHSLGEAAHEELVPSVFKTGRKYNKHIKIPEVPAPEQLWPSKVFSILEPLFFNPNIIKIGHGVTFDIASIAKYFGELPSGPFEDSLVVTWIVNENRKRYGLKYLVKDIFGVEYDDENVGKCVEKYPFAKVAEYSYNDAYYSWELWKKYRPEIEAQGLEEVYKIECDMIATLSSMRLSGTRVDVGRLHDMHNDLTKLKEEAEGRIYLAAGHKFNINSVFDKRKVLYQEQGLNPWKQTKLGSDSTDNKALESFRGNAVVDALLEYQQVNKLLTTYVDAYLGTDGKPSQIYNEHIYSQYKQYGTTTGRLSCSDPNAQNIPSAGTELGKMVRGAFIAEDGGKLIVADYGQVELVILAHYLGSGKLYEGFLQGIDPHTQTANMLDQPRQICKTVNFAVLYGVGVRKLSGILKLPEKEVRAIVALHKKEFPETYAFKDALLRLCRSRQPVPYVRTLYGRKRRVPLIDSEDQGLRSYSERQAFNSLIQGTSADITKRAMNRVDQDPRRDNDIKLVFSVHDEIGLSAPASKADLAAEILREAMVGRDMQRLKIPLKADVHICQRWSEAKN